MSEKTITFGAIGPNAQPGQPYAPFAHQRAAHALRLVTRFLVLVWHRRAGKTAFSLLELVMAACDTERREARFGYIAPLLGQAKRTAWSYLKHFAHSIPGAVIHEGELRVDLPNGARVQLFGADNPDSFRGQYFDGVVIDEVADIKPNLFGEVIRPALMDRQGWAIFIGTPKGVNLFSKLYYDALKGEAGWRADMRRWSDTSVLTEAEIDAARREMSPSQWAQEMECDFAAAVDDALIKLPLVLEAQARKLSAERYHYASRVMGLDCARYGNDRTTFGIRQGVMAFPPVVMKQASVTQVASNAARFIDKEQPDGIFADDGGVGGGVIDILTDMGYPVVPVNFAGSPDDERFQNKRAEMWWLLADWMPHASLPDAPDIATDMATDLTAPRFTYKNVRGKFQLESKDDMRARGMKSPDLGDYLACTFFAPVVPAAMRRRNGGVLQTQYDWRTHGKTQ